MALFPVVCAHSVSNKITKSCFGTDFCHPGYVEKERREETDEFSDRQRMQETGGKKKKKRKKERKKDSLA